MMRPTGARDREEPDRFAQDVAGSYSSIRNALVHMMSVEWGWIDRCGGPALRADDYPTPASLIDHNFDLLFYDAETRAVGA